MGEDSQDAEGDRVVAEVLHDYGVRFIRSHSAVTLEYFWWTHMTQGGSLDVLVSRWVALCND